MSTVREKGVTGEDLTADYLVSRGYTLVARNYHSRYGEIDLIAQNETYLVFVEVKARKSNRFSAPREAVTPAKQRKIRETALCYLTHRPTELQPRFDVAEVYLDREKSCAVEYYENAF